MKWPASVVDGALAGAAPLAQRGIDAGVVGFGCPFQARPLGAVAELDVDVVLNAGCAGVQKLVIVHVLAVLRLLLGQGRRGSP